MQSKKIIDDRNILLKAVKSDESALQYASKSLKNDRELVLEVVKRNGLALQYASESFKNDREIVIGAVKNYRDALQYASESLKNDRELVLEVVKSDGWALEDASDLLKNDREVVLEAVKSNGLALQCASESLQNDSELELEAVKSDGFALEYASDLLKNNRELVLEAVKSHGWTLEYASESLKNDRELVLEAVKSDGYALEYASSTLASDRVIILEALKSSHGDAIEYVTHLDNDESIDDKTIIKFGKYKGFSVYEIAEFDHGYLEWVSKNVKDLDSKLAEHIDIVLSKQESRNIIETDVMKQYMKIEDRYSKIVNLLERKKDTAAYRDFYKGFFTLNGPLINNPDILFIGINPGAGAWKEINPQSGTNNTPLRMLGHDESFFSEIDWFQINTARGCWGKGRENKGYEWYQRDKPLNNQFPVNMIDILFAIAEEKYPDIEVSTNVEPEWGNEIKSRIMVTNLYPMITDRTNQLNTLFSTLKKENALKELWNTNGKKAKNWDVQKYFVSTTHDLVRLIKPKVIVCMGVQAYNDFTYTSFINSEKVFSTTVNDIPVIGFKREQNWRHLIPSIATMILMKLAERE